MDFLALFIYFFYSSWRAVKLHLLDMPSDKSWVLLVPFLLLEVWFRGSLLLLHFYTEYIKTGDRTVGRVDLHTRKLDLLHLLACFCLTLQVQWPNTPLLAEAWSWSHLSLGGVSYSSMVYWHASLHLPLAGISSFWWDLNVLTKVCLRAPRKEPHRTLDLHRVIYACLVTTRNSLKWEESWVRHRKTQNTKRKR